MMSEVFRSDLFKLRKIRSFRVCLIVAFVLGLLMSVLYYIAWQELNKTMEETLMYIESLGDYSKVVMEAMDVLPSDNLWSYVNVSLCDLNVLYIAAVVIGIFVGSEYSMGTIRNALTRGFSRNGVYFSKLTCAVIAMFLTVLSYTLGSFLSGCIMFGFTSSVPAGQMLLCIALYALLFMAVASFYSMLAVITKLFMAVASFYSMLAVITKKTGYAIALAMLIPILVTALINIIKIGNQDFGNVSRFWIFETITNTQKLVLSGEGYIPAISGAIYLTLSSTIGLVVFRKQSIS